MKFAFIEALGPTERDAVRGTMVRKRFEKGAVVFHDAEVGDCLYLVGAGRFAVVLSTADGTESIVRVVQPGEAFGELALVHHDNRRVGRVVAIQAGWADVLYRRDFDDLRDRFPAVDRMLVMALAERIKQMNEQAVEAMLGPDQRVLRRLAALADAYRGEPIRMSQEDIARLANTVRQTANRVLAAAEAAGAIRRERGVIHVVDAGKLQSLIEARRGCGEPGAPRRR